MEEFRFCTDGKTQEIEIEETGYISKISGHPPMSGHITVLTGQRKERMNPFLGLPARCTPVHTSRLRMFSYR